MRAIIQSTVLGAGLVCLSTCLVAFWNLGRNEIQHELAHLRSELEREVTVSDYYWDAADPSGNLDPDPAGSLAAEIGRVLARESLKEGVRCRVGVGNANRLLAFDVVPGTQAQPRHIERVWEVDGVLERVLLGNPVNGVYRNQDGDLVLATGMYRDPGVAVVLEQPLSGFLAPLRRAAIAVTLTLLIMMALAYRILRRALHHLVVESEKQREALEKESDGHRVAQNRIKALFDAVPDVLINVGHDGRVHEANSRLPELLGWAPSEVEGRRLGEFVPGAGPSADSLLAAVARRHRNADRESMFIAVHRDGSRIPVDLCVRPIGDDVSAGVVVSVRDFTHEAAARHETMEAQQRVQRLLDSTYVGVVGVSREGICTFANRTAAAILGHATAVSLRGVPVGNLFGGRGRHLTASNWDRQQAGGSIDLHRAHEDRATFVRAEGSSFPVEYWSTPITPGTDADGYVVTFLDITERRRAEESLQQRDAMHALISEVSSSLVIANVDSLRDAIMIALARVGEFLKANRVLVLLGASGDGGNPERFEWCRSGVNAESGSDPELGEESSLGARTASGQEIEGPSDEEPLTATLRSGDRVAGLILAGGRWSDGRARQALGAMLKIVLEIVAEATGRQRAIQELAVSQTRLQEAQKLEAIGSLAAGVAHEINTPMQYIGDNLEFLDRAVRRLMGMAHGVDGLCAEPDTPEALRERLRKLGEEARVKVLESRIPRAVDGAREGVAAVSKIVQAMKGFAHRGTGAFNPADLNQALVNTATVCRNEWKYVADLEFDLAPDMPAVLCRVDELNQVFLNLIVNAAHAIADRADRSDGARGTITVKTLILDDAVEIRISDTGCGIPEEVKPRVFEPFFTTKEVGRGSGQGLAIARSVVETTHGGRLCFESSVGIGTTFIISLPRKREGDLEEAA